MKKIPVLSSLLVIVTTQFANNCIKKGEKEALYNIYNTTVKIRTFYCFYAVGDEFTCGRYKAKDTTFTVGQAHQYCHGKIEEKRAFCEKPGYLNLLDNTVHLEGNVTCKYDQKQCYDTNLAKIAYWEYNSTLQLPQVHCGRFSEWMVKDNNTIFIENKHFGLILTESTKYNGAIVWKTNHKDVIVSEGGYNTSNVSCEHYSTSKVKFKNVSVELCRYEEPKSVPRVWYVYKYPTDVDVYSCCNISNETLPKNNTRLLELCSKVCNPQSCRLGVKLCKKPYKVNMVNMESDMVLGLPGCKYSDGFCKKYFWQYTNRCEEVRKYYESIEKQSDESEKYLDLKGKGGRLVLKREGKLCEQTVWYTDRPDLVASEKELGFYQAKSIVLDDLEKADFSWFQPRLDTASSDLWSKGKYYLLVPLAVCIFWIAFKFVVCPFYLCSERKTVTNQKVKRSVSEEIGLRRMRLALNLPIVDQDQD